MPDHWSVHITGADVLEKRVRQFELLLSDLRTFWPLVVPLATGWWKRQFETEGAFAGRPWAPLSPEYALFKSRAAPGRGILQFSGEMKRAVSRPARFATARSLVLTIEDPKIEFHQEGTVRLPARPVVFDSPLPFQAQLELDAAADRYVSDFLSRL